MIGTSCLLLSLALQSSASIFFHELSHIVLLPEAAGDHTTFGFSLAYQQNGSSTSLVTGAPHSGLTGKVFKCPFDNVLSTQTSQCRDVGINVDELAPYTRDTTPDLKLNLGASISATPEYFFTCAPLWSSSSGSHSGTCFMYNGTAHRYNGVLEQYLSGDELESLDDIKGGTGWRTLIDQANDLLLIAKVALAGDIAAVNASWPLAPVSSFISEAANRIVFKDYRNIGTSMVAGNFFDKTETVYAISSFDSKLIRYTIHFLLYAMEPEQEELLSFYEYFDRSTSKIKNLMISVKTVGSMFGAAMGSADLDRDGFAELLVGAPAQEDGEGGSESGALHIYLGGDAGLINDISRHFEITGTREASRFGAAVASSDIDGDGLPEMFVSAPYEDTGEGALYVLSGFEINKDLIKRSSSIKKIALSQLKYTQRIKNSKFKTFGYSLQVISDLDGNGCNELAVGSPGSDNIMLLRCLPSIKVDVDIKEVGDKIVKEQDVMFTRKVCVDVKHLTQAQFSSTLKIRNKVIGVGAHIEREFESFSFDVNGTTEEPTCRDVIVKMSDHEAHDYKFFTKVEMDEGVIINSKEFKNTWAMICPTSVMEKSIDISRHCEDKDCEPKLSMTIGWSGKNESYVLGSSELLTVSLLVKNEGKSSFDSCVKVEVSGAPVSQFGCTKNRDGYKCFLPRPLKRTAEHKIDIKLNMTQPTNLDEEINVKAHLFEYCDQGNSTTEALKLKLILSTSDIFLKGSSHNQDISDTEIQNVNIPNINDAHEYLITNDGSVYWKNIYAMIYIEKEPFIASYGVSAPMNECKRKELTNRLVFKCNFEVPPRTTAKIIASTLIVKSKIMNYLVDGKLNITSSIMLYLKPTPTSQVERLSTSITLQKEQSLAQNKGLIIFLAVLGAAMALGVLVFIMYKMDFFKRTEKTKLNALKQEHVRRQSVKRSMSISHDRTLDDVLNNMDLEVIDDSPFEIIDMTEPVLKQDRENGDT